LPLRLPPLRERREDIPELSRRILDEFFAGMGRRPVQLEPEAVEDLQSYGWPGNIRELKNVLERALLLAEGDRIESCHLRMDAVEIEDSEREEDLTLEQITKLQIQRILASEGGHVGRAARRLGIPRSSLYEKVKKYGLARPDSGTKI
jgi:DNA-binding NtrC family response regulator